MSKRVIILILDSFGVGGAPDANQFGDYGSNTLGSIARTCYQNQADTLDKPVDFPRKGKLYLPNLNQLGLGELAKISCGTYPEGFEIIKPREIKGAYGCASEISTGKDTPSGHWEITGVPVLYEWGYFKQLTNSFPQQLIEDFITQSEIAGILGNCHASGTEIIKQLGEEHIKTKKPILYTSADSVLQIAAHETFFGLEKLYKLCTVARKLVDPYNIGRVIARPFIGNNSEDFKRTGNRKDYAVPPPEATILDKLIKEKSGKVWSIGKIADIFAHRGITHTEKATGLEALFNATIKTLKTTKADDNDNIIFTNFVDFDAQYGHRRDIAGYAGALEYFDKRLPELLALLDQNDLLIISADHGCDPTWRGTDHTRENIPVIVYNPNIRSVSLGRRNTFADIGQTIAQYFNLSPVQYGQSFLNDLAI